MTHELHNPAIETCDTKHTKDNTKLKTYNKIYAERNKTDKRDNKTDEYCDTTHAEANQNFKVSNKPRGARNKKSGIITGFLSINKHFFEHLFSLKSLFYKA